MVPAPTFFLRTSTSLSNLRGGERERGEGEKKKKRKLRLGMFWLKETVFALNQAVLVVVMPRNKALL